MTRELEITINDIDDMVEPHISCDTFHGYYTGKGKNRRIFAGYEDENEATRLTFKFGTDFVGYTISVQFAGVEATTYLMLASDLDFSYDIPEEYMIPEVIKMQIVASLSGQELKSRMIYLEVKRNA